MLRWNRSSVELCAEHATIYVYVFKGIDIQLILEQHGVNCTGSFIGGLFPINAFSLSCDLTVFFSLAHFIVW